MNNNEDFEPMEQEAPKAEEIADKIDTPDIVEEIDTAQEMTAEDEDTAEETVQDGEEATAEIRDEAEETAEAEDRFEEFEDTELEETEIETVQSEPVEEGAVDPDAIAAEFEATEAAAIAGKKKKKSFIQLPVIISLCIVLLSIIGYFTYSFFFLREPEGVTWANDYDGVTYYFEFQEGGVFKAYVGSVELTSTYEKVTDNDKNYIIVNADAGDFYSGKQASYEITGSRILNNQEFKLSYEDDDKSFSLTQAKERVTPLELPAEFTPDEKLSDTWVFTYYGYEYCTVIFGEDGSMSISYPQNGITYNGTYTVEEGKVNFTYYIDDYIVQPIEYTIDGDTLTFMDMPFVRASSLATANEAATEK